MLSFRDIFTGNHGIRAAVLAAGLLVPAVASAAPAMVSSTINVRSGPGAGYARLVTLPAWTAVDAGPCRAGWCQVRKGGNSGWVSARYIRFGARGYAVRSAPAYVSGYAPVYAPAYAPTYANDGWGPGFGLGVATGWATSNWGGGWNNGWNNGWNRGWRGNWRGGPNHYNGCIGRYCQAHFGPGWNRNGWKQDGRRWNPQWGVGPQFRPGWNRAGWNHPGWNRPGWGRGWDMGPRRIGGFGGFHIGHGARPDYAGR